MTNREIPVTDREGIVSILDDCRFLHLALIDGGEPYVLPMNYGYCFEGDKLVLYLHSGRERYKLRVMEKSPRCAFEMSCHYRTFEGRVACQYGVAYDALHGRGTVRFVRNPEEKKKAMTLLMKAQTGGDFSFNDRLVSVLEVIRIDVEDYAAKRRPLPAVLREDSGDGEHCSNK